MSIRPVAPPALPPVQRLPLALAGLASAVVVVLLGGLYSGQSSAGALDTWAVAAAGGRMFDPSPLRSVALVIDFGGEPIGAAVLLAALAVACWWKGRRRLAVLAVCGPWLTVSATTIGKTLTDRTINGDHLSYPSGHAAAATAMALVLALLFAESRRVVVLVVAVAAGAAQGWAQIVLNAHYPTDTIGGLCTALAVVPAAAWLIDRVWPGQQRS